MRSSGSTRSLPRVPIRLGIVLVGDDHARACTGRRLLRRRLARPVRRREELARDAILLDPYARVPLSAADRPRAEHGGIVAVDCSWNRLAARRSRESGSAAGSGSDGRRLPMLVAANPQHFGHLGELNTVEALAAALWVVGRADEAARLLEGFAGGDAFLKVNRERLDRYRLAESGAAILEQEHQLFGSG